MLRSRYVKQCVTGLLLGLVVLPCFGKVYYSKSEAMVLAFGKDAEVEVLSLFPDPKQVSQIEQLAKAKVDSSLISFYVGKKDGVVLGYAAIEHHNVRTKPETLLVVLSANGKVSAIHTLAFHEPPEYQPPQRWYEQLYQRELVDLSFNKGIQGMTGATLSTRSALTITRKIQAVFQVMIKGLH